MPSDLIKPEVYSPQMIQTAYEAYLAGNFNYEQMSLELGVSPKVVKRWVEEGEWRKRKMELDREMFEHAESEYRKFISKNRTPVAERHVRVASAIEDTLEKQIDDFRKAVADGTAEEKYPGATMKRMAEALSSVTGVSARAVGMSDRVGPVDLGNGQGGGKQPLVVVGVQVSKSGDVSVDARDA